MYWNAVLQLQIRRRFASSTMSCLSWLTSSGCAVRRFHADAHDRDAPGGHDITEEGLHRDVYRDGEKIRSEDVSPPIPANEGFDAAEEDLRENVEGAIKRFEKWHGVKDRSDL